MIFRFSDVFYIDATNQQTLETDLIAITPINIEQSIAACQHWLASQHEQNWLLFFDNADDVQLNLATFFPNCRFGNILVTTCNPQLSIHAGDNADEKIGGMNPDDAKLLLLQVSRADKNDENKTLAALIVKVISSLFSFTITCKLIEDIGTALLCIGHLPSCSFHPSSLQVLIKKISRALPTTS